MDDRLFLLSAGGAAVILLLVFSIRLIVSLMVSVLVSLK